MKTTTKIQFIIVLTLVSLALNVAKAQEPTIINDSIFSKALNEQRKIKIRLPEEYKPGSTAKYDVVYMIDGEWNFDNFSFIYKFAKDEKFLPPLIFVALPNTYGSEGNMRDRDFLPEKMVGNSKAGGADNFLAFLKNEVIPYIDKKLPTSGENSLFGHSYGGVFAMYALLKEPGLFANYYSSDPAFHWNNRRMIEIARETFKKTSTLNKTLWINGIEETYRGMCIDQMDSVLKAFAPKGLRWKITYYPNETHNSVRLKGVYDGLKYTYSGFNVGNLVFHPMNGSLLEGKPTRVFLAGNYPDAHYTTDGKEPDTTSKRALPMFEITGPAKLTVKSFSENKKYGSSATGNFELTKVWPSIPNAKGLKLGGVKYAYYEGKWETLPDFSKLKPIKTGIADSTFSLIKLPSKSNFACVFEGYLKIEEDGYYIFGLSSDDGTKFSINGREILNNDGVHDNSILKSYVAPLQKGFYPVRLAYFQGGGDINLTFLYVPPSKSSPVMISFKMLYYK